MLTASLLPTLSLKTTEPAPTAPAPTTAVATMLYMPTKTVIAPQTSMPFTCTTDACTGTGATDLAFRTLQDMINRGNAKLASASVFLPKVTIAVDGRITPTTLKVYLPISRAVGGKLAIFDFTPDIKYLATNAATFAREIAQWVGVTWVDATATVPGHWERLRAGQLSVIPTMVAAPLPVPVRPVAPLPLPTPPPSTMTMFVCPDGTRVSNLAMCPTSQARPSQEPARARVDVGPTTQPGGGGVPPQAITALPSPDQFPGSSPPPQSERYKGCIARFNKTRKVFSIYCPLNTVPQGFGLADEYFKCLYGNCGGLGADAVTPPVPVRFNPTPVITTTALPGAGETPAGEEKDKFFRANNPLMWVLFAGTAAAVGGGSYWMIRRRKRAAQS